MNQIARFQVDPRLATLLGEGYRSSERALKELVDNAWDADACLVEIFLPSPMTSDEIRISDDGSGMTANELRNEYLVVANDRRSRKGERTPRKNRLVKGRKGIGKFAGLMSANIMVVETRARGILTRLCIRKDDLLSAGRDLEGIDLPIEEEACPPEISGTTITLSDLNQNLLFPLPEKLKEILVLEYGRQDDFIIKVNGEHLSVEDIPGETFSEDVHIEEVGEVSLRFTVSEGQKPLKQAGIAIRVDGKIIGKPSDFGLAEDDEIPPKLLKRIYGELQADGLADDTTADWGAIIENSKGYQQVSEWVRNRLKEKIEQAFSREVNLAKARLQQEINKRLAQIPEHRREFARLALEKVIRRFYGESEERISVIVSVTLDAFEYDEYWTVLQKIDDATRQDVMTFAEALQAFGLLDMAIMAEQAIRRLTFLDELDRLVQNLTTREDTIHKAIEKNLWVLGANFALMSSNRTLARTIEEYTSKKFTGTRAAKRPDLLLSQNPLNEYLLIKFKRPSHALNRDDENQAIKYRDDLTGKFGKISILLLGGKRSSAISNQYEPPDLKVMSYEALISQAQSQLQWLVQQLGANQIP